jgi:hypothetical protein
MISVFELILVILFVILIDDVLIALNDINCDKIVEVVILIDDS